MLTHFYQVPLGKIIENTGVYYYVNHADLCPFLDVCNIFVSPYWLLVT